MDTRDICPKCGEGRRQGKLACPRCGLSLSYWDKFSPPPITPSALLAAAWQQLLASWEDEAAHRKLLDLAANQHELDTAAALYRARLQEQPNDAFGKQALDRALHLASVLGAQRSARSAPGAPAPLRALALLVALALLGIVGYLLKLSLRL